VALETRRDWRSTSSWWTHGRDKNEIHNSNERLLLVVSVIPAAMVSELSQQLNRRLGSICLRLGHVKIINKDDVSLAELWSEDAMSSLDSLVIEEVLSLIG
jgi:hypothetical protein